MNRFKLENRHLPLLATLVTLVSPAQSLPLDGGTSSPIPEGPQAQQGYLKASNPGEQDSFGFAVAVSGDTIVVAAPGERSFATGVNGDQADNSYYQAGAAYVYVRNGGSWRIQAYLKPSNMDDMDFFAGSIAISGNTIVVGAPREDSGAAGINGDEQDNSLSKAGAAYVFVRQGTTWTQQAYLKASNPDFEDEFGDSVAICGDTIVVGATGEDSSATGSNGNQADNNTLGAGAAYVFVRNGTNWTQQAYLKASNPDQSDQFGHAMAISEDTIVVGAKEEDSNATGVNGNQADDSLYTAGAAYVFHRQGTSWSQQAYLKASNAGYFDNFGCSVDIAEDTIIVGAYSEDSAATGVNGAPWDNSAQAAGAAYVFVRNGSSWSQQAYLKASNTEEDELFGYSVAIDGDRAVVGAWKEDSNASVIDGWQGSNSADLAGAAYLFERNGMTWTQRSYLKASNTEAVDAFGRSVDMSGETIVSGAPGEDSATTTVDGDESNNDVESAGAAYVFHQENPGELFCTGDGAGLPCPCNQIGDTGRGCTSSHTNGAGIIAFGNAEFGADNFGMEIYGMPPGVPGLCIKGSTPINSGFGTQVGDGLLCLSPQLRSQVLVSDAADGNVVMTDWQGQPFGSFPNAANVGARTYYQWWYRDQQNTCSGQGFNFSSGWAVTWQ